MSAKVKERIKVLVVFYSMYGNTAKLAKAVAEGARQVENVDVSLRQVDELVPQEIIEANERTKRDGLKDRVRFLVAPSRTPFLTQSFAVRR